MPVQFTLTPKGGDEPAILQRVDDAMREHFGAPPDADHWYERWYDTIGFGLALGNDWDKLRELFPNKAAIIDWLAENYTTDAWYQRHK